MTKKHFQAFAEMLKTAKEDIVYDNKEKQFDYGEAMARLSTIDTLQETFTHYFKTQNPNFDAARFNDACSLDHEAKMK